MIILIITTSYLKQNYQPFENFYSEMSESSCEIDDYTKDEHVWNKLNCKTMLDYHNINLTIDVSLLADIWENFKYVCMKI